MGSSYFLATSQPAIPCVVIWLTSLYSSAMGNCSILLIKQILINLCQNSCMYIDISGLIIRYCLYNSEVFLILASIIIYSYFIQILITILLYICNIFMDNRFTNTFLLLDKLIAKLEANTGGQVPKEQPATTVTVATPPVETQPATEVKVEAPEAKKQEAPQQNKTQPGQVDNKKANEGKKQKKVKEETTAENAKKEQTVPAVKKQKKEKGQKKEEKKEQKKQEKKQQKKQDAEATVEDFANIDIRIGEIIECWKHPESDKLYCEKIKVCGEVREIASGLQQFVPIDEMKGLVLVMANLKPRPLAKFVSNGMVVCSANADHTDIRLIRPLGQNSERIYLEGYEDLFKTAALLPVLNPKKKILEKCLQHFRTDAEGFVVWKGIRARTLGGYLKSELVNGTVS